jgi:glucose-6-phosphate 1-dehydrogenase
METTYSDALVLFGATGDLAFKKRFIVIFTVNFYQLKLIFNLPQ